MFKKIFPIFICILLFTALFTWLTQYSFDTGVGFEQESFIELGKVPSFAWLLRSFKTLDIEPSILIAIRNIIEPYSDFFYAFLTWDWSSYSGLNFLMAILTALVGPLYFLLMCIVQVVEIFVALWRVMLTILFVV